MDINCRMERARFIFGRAHVGNLGIGLSDEIYLEVANPCDFQLVFSIRVCNFLSLLFFRLFSLIKLIPSTGKKINDKERVVTFALQSKKALMSGLLREILQRKIL